MIRSYLLCVRMQRHAMTWLLIHDPQKILCKICTKYNTSYTLTALNICKKPPMRGYFCNWNIKIDARRTSLHDEVASKKSVRARKNRRKCDFRRFFDIKPTVATKPLDRIGSYFTRNFVWPPSMIPEVMDRIGEKKFFSHDKLTTKILKNIFPLRTGPKLQGSLKVPRQSFW